MPATPSELCPLPEGSTHLSTQLHPEHLDDTEFQVDEWHPCVRIRPENSRLYLGPITQLCRCPLLLIGLNDLSAGARPNECRFENPRFQRNSIDLTLRLGPDSDSI